MPQCLYSRVGTHAYAPDPHILSRAVCVHCGHAKMCTKAKCATKYLKMRRTVMAAHGLQSLTVPLDEGSEGVFRGVLRECGIRRCGGGGGGSGCCSGGGGGGLGAPSVTLLEGLLPPPPQQGGPHYQLETVRSAIYSSPAVVVRKLHKVRRSDMTTDLLLADVTVSPALRSATRVLDASPLCVLPQYPAHVVLGTVPREGRRSVDALKAVRGLLQGRGLGLDPSRMRLVAAASSCAANATGGREQQQQQQPQLPPQPSPQSQSQQQYQQLHEQRQYCPHPHPPQPRASPPLDAMIRPPHDLRKTRSDASSSSRRTAETASASSLESSSSESDLREDDVGIDLTFLNIDGDALGDGDGDGAGGASCSVGSVDSFAAPERRLPAPALDPAAGPVDFLRARFPTKLTMAI